MNDIKGQMNVPNAEMTRPMKRTYISFCKPLY
jgi:hypothetical protein